MIDGWGDGVEAPDGGPGGWGVDAWVDAPDAPLPASLVERDAAWCPGNAVSGDLSCADPLDDLLDGLPDVADDESRVALGDLASLVDAEPLWVVPDGGGGYAVVREAGGWVSTVAGVAPGPGLAAAVDAEVRGDGRDVSGGSGVAGLVGLSDLELGEVAAGCQRLMSWARGVQAAAVAELSGRPSMRPEPSWRGAVSSSVRACVGLEVTGALCVTSSQAESLVAESVELVEDFAATHAALTAGRVDERRARVLLGELRGQDRDVARVVEAAVIDRAPQWDTRQLRRRVKTLLHRLAPVAVAERRREAEQRRHVCVAPAGDGMAWVEALLRAEDAAALKAVLDAGQKTLKRRDAAAGDPHARTTDQRRADVLARLAWTALSTGHIGTTAHGDTPETADTGGGSKPETSTSTDRADSRDDIDRDDSRDSGDGADRDGETNTRVGTDTGTDGDLHDDPEPHTAGTASTSGGDRDGERSRCTADPPERPPADRPPADRPPADRPPSERSCSDGPPSGRPSSERSPAELSASGGAPDEAPPPGGAPPAPSSPAPGAAWPGAVSDDAHPGDPGVLVLSSAHGRPVTVHVTVGLSTLTGLDEHPGHLDGYGPIPADVARHLSTAGIWQWVGTNDVTGAAVSHGRGRYTPTRDLIDHVILRDHTCRAPGCHTPAQHCDLDHTIVYPLGGTDACNLGLFCRHHHLLKHHTRWHVEQPHPGTFVWTSPTGRTTTITPEQTPTPQQPDTPDPPEPPPF